MNRFNRMLGHFFEDYDVLIMPTMAHPALPLGTINSNQQVEDVMQYLLHDFRLAPFTVPFNVTGQPAMSVPLHQSMDGLPIGTQFIGRFAGEETLLSLAGQLEAVSPWIARYPPVSIRQGQAVVQ
jgi:amidase